MSSWASGFPARFLSSTVGKRRAYHPAPRLKWLSKKRTSLLLAAPDAGVLHQIFIQRCRTGFLHANDEEFGRQVKRRFQPLDESLQSCHPWAHRGSTTLLQRGDRSCRINTPSLSNLVRQRRQLSGALPRICHGNEERTASAMIALGGDDRDTARSTR